MAPLNTRIAFTDEQAMLLETAIAFCRDKSPIRAVRDLLQSEHGFDHAVWNEMVALGWSAIAIPERFGGSGLSLAEVATITEPMGRHLLATPFASTQVFIQGMLAAAGADMQSAVLPRVAQGAISTSALFESDGDWDLTHITCLAERTGEAVTLHGAKTLVCDAAAAELFLISVLHQGIPALVLLDAADLPHGHLRSETVIDETRRSCRLELDGLTLPAAALITGPAALDGLRAMRDAALLLAAAEAAGGIAGVLDVTDDYLTTRTASHWPDTTAPKCCGCMARRAFVPSCSMQPRCCAGGRARARWRCTWHGHTSLAPTRSAARARHGRLSRCWWSMAGRCRCEPARCWTGEAHRGGATLPRLRPTIAAIPGKLYPR